MTHLNSKQMPTKVETGLSNQDALAQKGQFHGSSKNSRLVIFSNTDFGDSSIKCYSSWLLHILV